jgi:hypothetical protein
MIIYDNRFFIYLFILLFLHLNFLVCRVMMISSEQSNIAIRCPGKNKKMLETKVEIWPFGKSCLSLSHLKSLKMF